MARNAPGSGSISGLSLERRPLGRRLAAGIVGQNEIIGLFVSEDGVLPVVSPIGDHPVSIKGQVGKGP